jgi:hypothetical protein
VRATLALVLAALLLPAAAAAKRAPTAGEATAIRSAVRGFVAQPNSPAAKNDKVVSIAVSTLDPRYAAVRLGSPTVGPSVTVLHRSHGAWWVQELGSSLGCDAAPKAVMGDLGVGCSPPDAVAWIDDCGRLASRPTSLVLTCADANLQLRRLRWHGWGRGTATASASVYANDCKPYCAAGHFHSYPATVTATKLAACGRARVYGRLAVLYTGARPENTPRRELHAPGC